MNLILMGLPGAGKGTQGSRLAKELGIDHIASGQMIREEIAGRTTLGVQVEQQMAQGYYLTDLQALELIRSRISLAVSGFVLDGYPRSVRQADELSKGVSIDRVFWLDIDRGRCVERLAGRKVCVDCGRNYHDDWVRPKVNGKCDVDGGQLERRPEDDAAVVDRRLRIYFETTAPVIDHYRSQGLLKTIDARKAADEVYNSLILSLNEQRN